ncbi:MAG: hypothetical protein QNJ44_18460 [Rhodobacter sp.]|nr:hypothetical protein [Rhodobacter sp.]
MLNLTLDNLALLTGAVLLAGSLLGSALAFFGRADTPHAARSEARQFAAGGYERPFGWPERSQTDGGVPTRTYRTAEPPSKARRFLKSVILGAVVFAASAAALLAYLDTRPDVQIPGQALLFEVSCPAILAMGFQHSQCAGISADADLAFTDARSDKLSDTRLIWPETASTSQ